MLKKIEAIAKDVCAKHGVSLYDVELKHAAKGLVIVIYITKIQGIGVEDCSVISRDIGRTMEEDNLVNSRYFLEVSSPGLERKLKLKKHYVSAIGEKVKITYNAERENKMVIGVLKEVDRNELILELGSEELTIAFNDIKKAKTYFDYKKGN